jgi:hypothetical protein
MRFLFLGLAQAIPQAIIFPKDRVVLLTVIIYESTL